MNFMVILKPKSVVKNEQVQPTLLLRGNWRENDSAVNAKLSTKNDLFISVLITFGREGM